MNLTKTDFSAAYSVTSKNSLGERDFLKTTHFPNALFCFLITPVQNTWKICGSQNIYNYSGAETSVHGLQLRI